MSKGQLHFSENRIKSNMAFRHKNLPALALLPIPIPTEVSLAACSQPGTEQSSSSCSCNICAFSSKTWQLSGQEFSKRWWAGGWAGWAGLQCVKDQSNLSWHTRRKNKGSNLLGAHPASTMLFVMPETKFRISITEYLVREDIINGSRFLQLPK